MNILNYLGLISNIDLSKAGLIFYQKHAPFHKTIFSDIVNVAQRGYRD